MNWGERSFESLTSIQSGKCDSRDKCRWLGRYTGEALIEVAPGGILSQSVTDLALYILVSSCGNESNMCSSFRGIVRST